MKKERSCIFVSDYMSFVRCTFLTCFLLVVCFTQLSGCGVAHKDLSYDRGPSRDVDVSKVRDAVPKHEPFHPYGRKDYTLKGRKYRVLKNANGYVKHGYASWYGTKFHGRHTSTQETFDMYEMTAASKELPLPSYAKVTNLQNGKTAIVRVNDRGPFYKNRIIDLSYAAAKKLGFADQGITKVKVEAIDSKKWAKSSGRKEVRLAKNEDVIATTINSLPETKIQQPKVFLQIGAFSKLDNAEKLSDKVTKLIAKPVEISQMDSLYRVHVGPLASASQGGELKKFLEENGFEKVSIIDG